MSFVQPVEERALLIGVKTAQVRSGFARMQLLELGGLVRNLGMQVLESFMMNLQIPDSRYFLGTGKVAEISEKIQACNVELVIFDHPLTPSQQRNLEKEWGLPVIDRHEVILEIFARRASTREAILQVALARMQYSLPRLTRAWTHLSRQRGGARGNRGKGETQLETDRRLVLDRISQLKRKINQVASQRNERRKKREYLPLVSITGYTNAGKSSLLNTLCKTEQFSANKLFVTLDPATRSCIFPGGKKILLTDTVGFIRGLPHDLIDAFRSTLEEVLVADLILHIVDISSPQVEEEIDVSNTVLKDIGADSKKILLVFNKTDRVDEERICFFRGQLPKAEFISSLSGKSLERLKERILYEINKSGLKATFEFPIERWDICSRLHTEALVTDEQYLGKKVRITAILSQGNYHRYSDYLLVRY